MKSAVAVAQYGTVERTTPQLEEGFADLMMGITTPRGSAIVDEGLDDGTDSSVVSEELKEELPQGAPENASGLQSTLDEITRLQVDVSGMEAIVSAVKGVGCSEPLFGTARTVEAHHATVSSYRLL